MKKWMRISLLLALVLVLTGCGRDSAVTKGMDNFMTAWISGGADAQFMDSDGELVTGIANTGLAGAMMQKVTYAVRDAEDGTLTLEITAPDAAAVLEQAVAGMDTFSAEVFQTEMEELLEGEVPLRTFTVEVEMGEADGTWYPILSAEMVNALTGGLPEAYAAAQQQIFDSLMEGGIQ